MKGSINRSELLTANSFVQAKSLDKFKQELLMIDNLNTK